jgi:RHS repeat-associated protein
MIRRTKPSFLLGAALLTLSNLHAQVSPPSPSDVSPTVNTEVSSMIHTGGGYDAWTGSVHRSITDLEVPGAVSSLGLKWVRTYNSSVGSGTLGWSFSWTWRRWGRGWGGDPIAVHLPDGGAWRITEPGMKLRWDELDDQGSHCGESCLSGHGYLYLEDGSKVHMGLWREPPEPDQSPPRNYWIDHYEPTYVEDPYGRRTTLQYEDAFIPTQPYEHLRLKQVTDPSGRWIKITYACDNNCNTSNWWKITRVDGSDGSWVSYTWDQANAGYLTHVGYSDGTRADYTYGNTTYWRDTVCGCNPTCYNCTITGNATKLLAAWDTHADSPMQSIYYQYKLNGRFEGQIQAEKQLLSATPTASPAPGVTVSSLTSTSCPTHPWSQSPDCPSATQREDRGDGPYRSLYLEQATAHVPLVKRKQDFQNHIDEVYTYDSNNYLRTVQDRNGYTTTYTNEPVIGNPTQIKHPDNTHIDYTYSDPNNPYHIQTVTDERGKMTTYTRDGNNRITRIDYPADANTPASYETFTYNSFGQVLTHRRKNGYYEHAWYQNGLMKKLWNPTATSSYPPSNDEAHITLTYYASPDPSATPHPWQDRVQTITYPPTGIGQVPVETYEYDRAFGGDGTTNPAGPAVHGRGLVTKIIHCDNTYQSFGYDAYGNKRWEENELRKRTTYTYDDYKRVLRTTNPLGKITRSDYAPTEGNTTQCYMHTANTPYWVTTPANIKTHNVYDGNFRKTSATAAYGTSQALTTSFGYDNVGNVTDVTGPLAVTHSTFDNRNRKLTATEAYGTNLAQTITWHYDDASNIYQIDRPDNTTETKSYDALNRVLTDTVPKSTNPVINIVTTFNYNPSGTLNWVKDGENHTYNFAYDPADRKTSMTYPDGSLQQWAYDDVGNPKWRITVSSKVKYFYYDCRNRLYATWWYNWDDSLHTPDWRYFGYDDASRLIEAENGTGGWGTNVISDVHRFYDDANHLTQEQQSLTGLWGAGPNTINYPTYDDDGKLTSMNVASVPDYNYTFSYDAMGRFEKIFITNGSQLFQYYYDAASNERERDNISNGVQQIYPRDILNRMRYLDVRWNNSTLGHEGYSYDGPDGAMNRLTSVDYGNGHSDSFSYYLNGELSQAQLGNFNRNLAYNLDKAGNRTSVVDTGVTKNYSRNNLNQYTTGDSSSIINGPEHEISDYQGNHYTYRNDEQLISVQIGTNDYRLVYDALGRCVKRTLNSDNNATYYVYDGEKPILEYDANGNRVGFNLYGKGIDEILKRGAYGTDSQWHWYFFQQNHEGTVTHLTDASGTVIERYRYDVFGAPIIYAPNWSVRSITSYDNRFLFTGREYAATYRSTSTGLTFYEYRARAYNPQIGRFMSEDPKTFDAGDYNLFRYCHNDPLDFTDPMGLWGIGDLKETAYSLWNAGPRATWDAQPFWGDTTGKFAVQQGKAATKQYGNNPNAGESVRHEVWEAELARKWGQKAAKAIGDAHERFKSRDARDSKRDQYHNELGRQNAKQSNSREDSLAAAKADWESGRAARDKFDSRLDKSTNAKSSSARAPTSAALPSVPEKPPPPKLRDGPPSRP